jgi:hypothetical protein
VAVNTGDPVGENAERLVDGNRCSTVDEPVGFLFVDVFERGHAFRAHPSAWGTSDEIKNHDDDGQQNQCSLSHWSPAPASRDIRMRKRDPRKEPAGTAMEKLRERPRPTPTLPLPLTECAADAPARAVREACGASKMIEGHEYVSIRVRGARGDEKIGMTRTVCRTFVLYFVMTI